MQQFLHTFTHTIPLHCLRPASRMLTTIEPNLVAVNQCRSMLINSMCRPIFCFSVYAYCFPNQRLPAPVPRELAITHHSVPVPTACVDRFAPPPPISDVGNLMHNGHSAGWATLDFDASLRCTRIRDRHRKRHLPFYARLLFVFLHLVGDGSAFRRERC